MTLESHVTRKQSIKSEYDRMTALENKRGLNKSEQNYLFALTQALLHEDSERTHGNSRDNTIRRES